MDADHVFSHIHWKMRIYLADLGALAGAAAASAGSSLAAETAAAYEAGGKQGEYRWIGPEDMDTLAFPNLFIRILREYWT